MCLALFRVTFVLGLLIFFTPPTSGDCPTSFHAEDITREEGGSFEFYFTGRGFNSATECARFCGRRQFCRTAVFDESASTCSITYGFKTSCREPSARFNSFTSKSVGLVAISCVDLCPSEEQNGPSGTRNLGQASNGAVRAPAKTTETSGSVVTVASPGTSALAPEVSSSGASAQPTTQSTLAPPAPTTAEISKAPTTTTHVSEAGSILTSTTATSETASVQSATSTAPRDIILQVAFVTAAKDTIDDAVTATTASLTSSVELSTTPFTTTEALTTSSTKPSITSTEYTGPAFITASSLGEANPTGNDTKPFSPMDLGGAEVPCFAFQPRQALLNAVFATELVGSLAECKCLCASSWLSNRYSGNKCKSLQYSPSRRECHLNNADHQEGSLQYINGDDGGYYWFQCYRTEHDVTNFVLNECRGLLPPPVQPNDADSTAPCFEVINGYLIKGTAGGLEHDVSIEQCQCYCAHSQTSGRYAFQCLSATYYHQERDCVLNLDNRINRTDLYDRNDKSAYTVSYMGMTCSPGRARAQFPSHAAGASNGGGEQVCGRFDGNTLVIRPVTSDTKFTLVTESSITAMGEVSQGGWIGGSTSSKSVDSVGEKHTPETGARVGIALRPGVNSDPCFLELPNYVLEGMALAIESKVAVEACKCFCIGAEKRYGSACQSFQYYYDSMTCLLNRENRISHPDRFNVLPSVGLPHSYFDYRCAANGVVLSVYVDSTCEGLNIDISIPKSSESSFPVESTPVRYATSESPTSSSTSGSAFITADPNVKYEASESPTSSSTPGSAFITADPNVKYAASENPTSSSTSGAAFITADPNETEPPTPIAIANFVTETTSAVSASSAIEGPESILSVSEKPKSFAPVAAPVAFPTPSAGDHIPNSQQRFANSALAGPEAEVHRSETSATLAPAPIAYEVKTPSYVTPASASIITITTEPLSTTWSSTTTTEQTTTTTTTTEVPPTTTAVVTEETTESSTRRTFKPVGPCRYSAIYETAFQGSKMVDRVEVTSPAQCFSACKEVGCRSANLIQSNGLYKQCELFRDSFIDYRTPDVLSFSSGTVYFDGIECSQKV